MRALFVFFFVSLLAQFSFAQNKAKVDSLKKLGRDSLIKLAIKKLNEQDFDPAAYDRIIVKADSSELVVDFDLPVKFKGGKKCYYDAISVALVGSGNGMSITGFCDEPKFYKPSAKQKRKIDFIFESINKKNEIGDIPDKKLRNDEDMEITEKVGYYYVEFRSWSTFSHYKIQKGTGKIYDAGHKHYARSREDKPRYEIIK
ncbi:MAG: hypothetical protein Q8M29_15990 [Bacteroidota bacterium]|nr:hypothetical protein [Bacteroidota bacterium]